tara:strand:+ start:98 stop:964 length:867 start_codon:yes stop_codon:yes gene_type:complete
MSFTYTELKQAIQDYTENDETTFVRNLPLFIKNTEERILKNVQLSLFRKNVAGSMSISNKFLTVPNDFLAPFSLSFTKADGEYVFLDFKGPDFMQVFTPNSATVAPPRYYGVFDVNNFILAPTPDVNYAAELHYFYRPESLTKSSYTLTLTSVVGTFTAADTITGGTSGVSSGVELVSSSTSLEVIIPSSNYVVGETITASPSGATGVITAVSADTSLTWLSENADLGLLYGSLMEAYIFMKGEPDIQALYEKRFIEAVMGLKLLGESKEVTDEYRTGQIIRKKDGGI